MYKIPLHGKELGDESFLKMFGTTVPAPITPALLRESVREVREKGHWDLPVSHQSSSSQ